MDVCQKSFLPFQLFCIVRLSDAIYISEKQIQSSTVPEIDWDQKSLAFVTYSVPTSGYSITSADYTKDGDTDRIAIVVQGPGKNCVVTEAFETIYTLVPVPKDVVKFETSATNVENPTSCPQ